MNLIQTFKKTMKSNFLNSLMTSIQRYLNHPKEGLQIMQLNKTNQSLFKFTAFILTFSLIVPPQGFTASRKHLVTAPLASR